MVIAGPPFWIPWQLLDDLQGQQKYYPMTITQRTQVLQRIAGQASQLMPCKHLERCVREESAQKSID